MKPKGFPTRVHTTSSHRSSQCPTTQEGRGPGHPDIIGGHHVGCPCSGATPGCASVLPPIENEESRDHGDRPQNRLGSWPSPARPGLAPARLIACRPLCICVPTIRLQAINDCTPHKAPCRPNDPCPVTSGRAIRASRRATIEYAWCDPFR